MKMPWKQKKILYRVLDKFLTARNFLQVQSVMKNHRLIDFNNPKTFNDWLQWTKLYSYEPWYAQ